MKKAEIFARKIDNEAQESHISNTSSFEMMSKERQDLRNDFEEWGEISRCFNRGMG